MYLLSWNKTFINLTIIEHFAMEDSYTTPNIRGNHYLALAIVLLVLAIFAVALRFWSNHISPQHSFQPDDFFVIVALVGVQYSNR